MPGRIDRECEIRVTVVVSMKASDGAEKDRIGMIRLTRGQLRGMNSEFQPMKVVGLMFEGKLVACTVLFNGAVKNCQLWCKNHMPDQPVFDLKYPEDRSLVLSFRNKPKPVAVDDAIVKIEDVPIDIGSPHLSNGSTTSPTQKERDIASCEPGSQDESTYQLPAIDAFCLQLLGQGSPDWEGAYMSSETRRRVMAMDHAEFLSLASKRMSEMVEQVVETAQLQRRLEGLEQRKNNLLQLNDRLERYAVNEEHEDWEEMEQE